MKYTFSQILRNLSNQEQKLDNLLLFVDFFSNRHDLPMVLLKDGSLILLFELAGVDYEGLSQADKEQYSYYLKSALELMPNEGRGYMVSNIFIREKAELPPLKSTPDALPLLQFVQRQKQVFWNRVAGQSFRNRLVCCLRFYDPAKPEPSWRMMISEDKLFRFYQAQTEEKADRVYQAYLSLKSALDRFGFQLLSKEACFGVLYQLVNQCPPPRYREDLSLNAQIPQSNFHFSCGEAYATINRRTHINVIGIKYPPQGTVGLYLRRFYELDFPFYMKQTFGFGEKSRLYKQQDFNKNIAASLSSINKTCAAYVEEIKDFQNRLESEKELPIWWHFAIYILSDNPEQLKDRTYRVINLLKEIGSAGLVEENNLKNGLFALFPGHERFYMRKSLITTANIGDLFSAFNLSPGDPDPIEYFQDRPGGIFAWSPFNQRLNAYHMAITGPTGSGKSFAVQKMLISSLVNNPKFYVIDLSQSFLELFEFLREEYPGQTAIMTVSRERTAFKFNPFLIEDFDKPVPEHQMNFCLGLLRLIVGHHRMTPNTEWVLRQSLEEFFRGYRILLRNRRPSSPPIPPLTILADIVEVEAQQRELANAIRLWTVGRKGEIFNSGEDTLQMARYCYFDIRDLESDDDLTSTIVYCIFAKIYSDVGQEEFSHVEKYLFLDEAHRYLKHPEFAFWIELLFRIGRRYKLLMGVITQSISDLISDAEWSKGIVENIKQAFFFAGQKNIDDALRQFQISDYLIDSYHRLNPAKRELMYWSADGLRRILRPLVDPYTYWLATTDPDERKIRSQIKDSFGGDIGQALDACVRETSLDHSVKDRVRDLRSFLDRDAIGVNVEPIRRNHV